jgi:hypothetical protein
MLLERAEIYIYILNLHNTSAVFLLYAGREKKYLLNKDCSNNLQYKERVSKL